jgi:hypothetical protein
MASGYGINGGMYYLVSFKSQSQLGLLGQPLRNYKVLRLTRIPYDLSGPSRCFVFWQELLGCYVINAGDGEVGKKKCIPALEDYYECLHHAKEVPCVCPARHALSITHGAAYH